MEVRQTLWSISVTQFFNNSMVKSEEVFKFCSEKINCFERIPVEECKKDFTNLFLTVQT